MITVFGLDPRSVVIAFMSERLTGSKPVLFDPSKQFYFDEVEDARVGDFDGVYREFRERFGKVDFLEDEKSYGVMSADIFWSLRYRSMDREKLVMEVLGQIAEKGSKGYFSESTPEAREMRFRTRKVLAEFNRAMKYVNFRRCDDPPVSLASASFENDVADMLLRAEVSRNRGCTACAVFDDRNVTILFNGRVYLGKRQKIPLTDDRKGFKRFWAGLPETGKGLIQEDPVHNLKEIPEIIFPQDKEGDSELPRGLEPSLDDFSK